MSNTSVDDSDDDSSPVADINSHLTAMSVKDRMNLWRTAEKQSEEGGIKQQAPLIQPVHVRQPSANIPRIQSISRTERVEESKERDSSAEIAKAAIKELEEGAKRDKKASVREAYLQRLQRHQVERQEEQKRRHNEEYGNELDNARQAKHRAQESLQLKITVEKDTSAPVSRRTSPATPASTHTRTCATCQADHQCCHRCLHFNLLCNRSCGHSTSNRGSSAHNTSRLRSCTIHNSDRRTRCPNRTTVTCVLGNTSASDIAHTYALSCIL